MHFTAMLQSLPRFCAMAPPPPLTAWGVVSVFQGGIWMELKAVEARLRGEQQASEARQVKRTDELRADIKELRADNKALGEKIDRLAEIFATVRQA